MLFQKAGLVALLWLAAAGLAQAQTPSLESETFKQKLRSQYLRNDTAQAIITLYSRRQVGGATWIVSGALAAARAAIAGGSTTTVNGVVVDRQSANIGAIMLVTAPIVGYGLGKMIHYSNTRLDQQLASYAAGQPLPRRLRRKLKPRFFSQPIIEYKPVPVTPVK
ncbi:MAG TPA: hypothetical protein VK364_08080 [Hymenobacter sp.]|nr:hypothetical protein [Hymenobacter sp.]